MGTSCIGSAFSLNPTRPSVARDVPPASSWNEGAMWHAHSVMTAGMGGVGHLACRPIWRRIRPRVACWHYRVVVAQAPVKQALHLGADLSLPTPVGHNEWACDASGRPALRKPAT